MQRFYGSYYSIQARWRKGPKDKSSNFQVGKNNVNIYLKITINND